MNADEVATIVDDARENWAETPWLIDWLIHALKETPMVRPLRFRFRTSYRPLPSSQARPTCANAPLSPCSNRARTRTRSSPAAA